MTNEIKDDLFGIGTPASLQLTEDEAANLEYRQLSRIASDAKYKANQAKERMLKLAGVSVVSVIVGASKYAYKAVLSDGRTCDADFSEWGIVDDNPFVAISDECEVLMLDGYQLDILAGSESQRIGREIHQMI